MRFGGKGHVPSFFPSLFSASSSSLYLVFAPTSMHPSVCVHLGLSITEHHRESERKAMDELNIATTRLKLARFNHEKAYEETISDLDGRESNLAARLTELDQKKQSAAEANGNPDAADDDLVEINAGGKIVAAKRSTLTRIAGTRFEALFSGRWDKILQRDSHGRIFLDVNPSCFRAIVDHLNEMIISSEDTPPDPPSVDDEHYQILQDHLELFDLPLIVILPDSNIMKERSHINLLHAWLKEDGSEGDFGLLYRSSRDGIAPTHFHTRCDNKGCTLTIIETTCGRVIGGYSNISWTSHAYHAFADKTFLFVLASSGLSSPCKLKLKNADGSNAIYSYLSHGPTFGGARDMIVDGSSQVIWYSNPLGHSYHPGPLPHGAFTIKEIEVFQVTRPLPTVPAVIRPVTRFSDDINKAITEKQACLLKAETEMQLLEDNFIDKQEFIQKFASGVAKDVVVINVSGAIMATKRSTLCIAIDSVLSQQFDDSKWTEQGFNGKRVKDWGPDEVSTWAKGVDGLSDNVSIVLYENEITGRELLALNIEGLKMMGIERAGTLCLVLDEIKFLKQKSEEIVTLIEHSPYCFGKILDYLRSKQLHSLGLLVKEPALPEVQESEQKRFEVVVKYYFPGDSAKFILGGVVGSTAGMEDTSSSSLLNG